MGRSQRIHPQVVSWSGAAVAALVCVAMATGAGCAEISANPMSAVSIEELAATNQRPLFSPSRRPMTEPVAPVVVAETPPLPQPSPPDPAPFVLVGTVTGAQTRIAIVQLAGTGEVVTLAPGATQDGWSVRAVAARSISVAKEGRAEDIALGQAAEADTAGLVTRQAERAAVEFSDNAPAVEAAALPQSFTQQETEAGRSPMALVTRVFAR